MLHQCPAARRSFLSVWSFLVVLPRAPGCFLTQTLIGTQPRPQRDPLQVSGALSLRESTLPPAAFRAQRHHQALLGSTVLRLQSGNSSQASGWRDPRTHPYVLFPEGSPLFCLLSSVWKPLFQIFCPGIFCHLFWLFKIGE